MFSHKPAFVVPPKNPKFLNPHGRHMHCILMPMSQYAYSLCEVEVRMKNEVLLLTSGTGSLLPLKMLGRVPGAVSYNNKLLVDSVEEVLPQLRCYDEN